MGRLDFHVEFNIEVEHLDEGLLDEADQRLWELAEGRNDMIGAAVAVEELTGEETPHRYQARIVAYIKPDNIVAVEKGEAPETAIKGALNALERQVRKMREKRGTPWQRPPQTPGSLATE